MSLMDDVDVAGHCYCGAIRFRVRLAADEKPLFSVYCHCSSCRRAHSAPLYQVVCVDEACFSFEAGEEHLVEFQKEAGRAVRAFCGRCGSKVLNRFPSWRQAGAVPLAFFPSLLQEETQQHLPQKLRPSKHTFAEECVLDAGRLAEILSSSR